MVEMLSNFNESVGFCEGNNCFFTLSFNCDLDPGKVVREEIS